ncbi:MAG: hypothetical protein R3B41_00785 [Candidatus Doudnabacteria bacterium]
MYSFKKITTMIVVTSLVLFTFLAILSIWDVLGEEVAWKSVATLAVITFSSIIALVVFRVFENREKPPTPPTSSI